MRSAEEVRHCSSKGHSGMGENQGHPERRVTRCVGLMRKPTIESVLALYTAVTGEEPPTEAAVKVRATFERDESEAQSKTDTP